MLHKLVFQPFGTVVQAQEGNTILQAAQEAGIHIPAYCGGEKTCGKCRIKIVEGNFEKHQINSSMRNLSPVTVEEKKHLTQKELRSGYRLACTTLVHGDVVIEIPEESRMQSQIILESGKARDIALMPGVKIYYLELQKPTLQDNRDDFTRIKDALGTYEELDQELLIDFEALRKLPAIIRNGNWKITVYILYGKKIISAAPGRVEKYYGAAVDIGTTTVVAYLCDLSTGRILTTGSFMNPQVRYGDDVISRISYCMSNENGVGILRELLVNELNKTLQELATSEGIDAHEICETVLVFNTVMACIALGITPEALGVSPFVSPISKALDISSRDVGLQIMPGGNVHCLPSEAGFIGADNVAVLIAEEPYKQDKLKLIIDIGTNSEICLGNKDKLYVTSCATGPALEGAQIQCGMRAARGAVEAVKIDPVTLEPTIKIIGGDAVTPVGICGSGILDVVAQMAMTGIIEPDGKFSARAESPRVRVGEKGKKEYVLYLKKTPQEHDIVVTMADIRAVQLAKAALYAGAKTLMNHCGIKRVDEVVLAGAFGSYIDKENAIKLGLFPDCRYEDITVAGNAAGVGAQLALLNTAKRAEAENVARTVEFIETATEEDFSKCFSQAMIIPHKKDTFTLNKPLSFACSGIHAVGTQAAVSDYPFKSPDELLDKDDISVRELVRFIIKQNTRDNLPEGLLDLPGPFAILGYLISPITLYTYGRKHGKTLDKVLDVITKELTAYATQEIETGVKIISYADPAGELEHVGERFYKQFSGKYNQLFFKQMEPSLKQALIHVCGKTSYSMEKTGLMLAKPYRTDAHKPYIDILFEEAKIHKVKFVGHACINNEHQPAPVLYRLELT